jgi:hypothetical protein
MHPPQGLPACLPMGGSRRKNQKELQRNSRQSSWTNVYGYIPRLLLWAVPFGQTPAHAPARNSFVHLLAVAQFTRQHMSPSASSSSAHSSSATTVAFVSRHLPSGVAWRHRPSQFSPSGLWAQTSWIECRYDATLSKQLAKATRPGATTHRCSSFGRYSNRLSRPGETTSSCLW